MRKLVTHKPVWIPADIPINAAGDTRPGFVCVHELENGNGECGGDVLTVEEAIGDHSCVVDEQEADEVLRCSAYAPGFWIVCGEVAVATVEHKGKTLGVCAEQVKDAREAGYVVTMIEEAAK